VQFGESPDEEAFSRLFMSRVSTGRLVAFACILHPCIWANALIRGTMYFACSLFHDASLVNVNPYPTRIFCRSSLGSKVLMHILVNLVVSFTLLTSVTVKPPVMLEQAEPYLW
jgi:hypothetical protein